MSRIFLIDGNGLGWRLASEKPVYAGEHDVSALHGLVTWLMERQESLWASRFILCFDGGQSALRAKIHPLYKGNRRTTDETLRVRKAIKTARFALESLGANVCVVNGVEADDLISIIAKRISPKVPVTIVSDDGDLYQCLHPNVTIYHPGRSVSLDARSALAKFGGSIRHFILWKALAGDPSDNVPGIRGIGAKRALELVHISEGNWRWLTSQDARSIYGKRKAFAALFEPGFPSLLYRMLRLVKTVTDPDELDHFGGLTSAGVEMEIRRTLLRLREPQPIDARLIGQFMRTHQCGFISGRLETFGKCFALSIN